MNAIQRAKAANAVAEEYDVSIWESGVLNGDRGREFFDSVEEVQGTQGRAGTFS